MEKEADENRNFTKEVYDRLTNLFTKMGFKYKGHVSDLLPYFSGVP